MKVFSLFFLGLISFTLKASLVPQTSHCLNELLHHSKYVDSRSFQIHKDSWEIHGLSSPEKDALSKLRSLLKELKCPLVNSEKKTKVSCHRFPKTEVCEIPTDGGVFLMADAPVDHINIIFYRWD